MSPRAVLPILGHEQRPTSVTIATTAVPGRGNVQITWSLHGTGRRPTLFDGL